MGSRLWFNGPRSFKPSPLRVDQQYIVVKLKSNESEVARHVSWSDDVDGLHKGRHSYGNPEGSWPEYMSDDVTTDMQAPKVASMNLIRQHINKYCASLISCPRAGLFN
jgi:hypothetical protein